MNPTALMTSGDARRIILETIQALRSGDMPATTGMAIAANMKVLNDSVQVEINAVKTAILAKDKGHDFGRIVGLGQRLLANYEEQK
ncbi:MAG: hypothetical protein ACEQSA_06455 [Weeksellaceae bacterium]